MGLLNKNKKKKPLRTTGRGAASAKTSARRPQQVEKLPPCVGHCPSGNDIRGWLTVIAQREKTGLGWEEALERAWMIEMETNPLPAIMGRVCPHPCETKCNRTEHDGAVAINSVERSLGDWGLEQGLLPPKCEVGGPFSEKIAVIGAGPAGLSCAYQLARRGYAVTIYEGLPEPGGMLRYGIPDYRLPRDIISAEIQRIADLGVQIECGKTVGKDVTMEELQQGNAAVFIGIGAHKGRNLRVAGEEGPGVYTGTEFLRKVALGEEVPIGAKVVVIGGGDTAIDAARVSLRLGLDSAGTALRAGSKVTILYRRTREEMPAIEQEIEEALIEDIEIVYLAAPGEILRNDAGEVVKMRVQRMELGEPDDSGRRRPVPIEGDTYELDVDTIITAVSQAPDTDSLGLFTEEGWVDGDEWGRTKIDGIWTGGDNINLGLATEAVGQGRKAAESIHATLRGEALPYGDGRPPIGPERIKMDFYEAAARTERGLLEPAERLVAASREIDSGITLEEAGQEAARCFSCGSCFGCERCWMYCTPGCFKKLPMEQVGLGVYYGLNIASCDGCDKCRDECPCGFLDMV